MHGDAIISPRILINLGCGPFVQKTRWQDCDGSWNVYASHLPLGLGRAARKLLRHKGQSYPPHVRYLDVTRKLPFAANSVDAVYFSHLLEHLHLDEGGRLLGECFRILKPGGVLRVVVPDTQHFLVQYQADSMGGDPDACLRLNKDLWFRPLAGKATLFRRCYTAVTDFHSHKFMYDRVFLKKCITSAGFTSITEVRFCESKIPEIADVELQNRIDQGNGFGFEGVRP